MTEIALHILDIVQNSIAASAKNVTIEIIESNKLQVTITDNGKGIDKEMIDKVADPFFTSRKTRKVGLGLSLFKQSTEQAGGSFKIESEPGIGTTIFAEYNHQHIDRPPLGDIAGVISLLVSANPALDFVYKHKIGEQSFVFDTRKIKETLEDIPVSAPEVQKFIKEMIEENIGNLKLEI